ncbi:ParB/RepB/Spo0J family partition protein [Microbacterium allomyrinae]|uniref:ParB/RepB/Spo0J family partition protein n=1 Tax=Microbacterium allomyrinae TaxID=2830666 RepID=A0A9X1LTR7_9MICO|nr:ParB/RepB/Spo0J family partition protein [Microbacterium allomyrinae]MCC2031810.1 ParB/RepB/Spo0J family partition protein [Microbacterium allomyrinae]
MTTATTAPGQSAIEQLQLITIDPSTLRSADQIREDATPDGQLIDSVRASGILQPPTVVWNDTDGAFYIVFGHRRVGAAILAGLAAIPVIVRDASTITGSLVLEQQIVENERREGVTQRELSRGWANLEGLFGLTPEDIATAIAEKPDRVRAGIRAARSEKTSAILSTKPAIDLEQAAVLTEFDEHPSVQAELADTASTKPADFEWKVRSARDKLAKDARVAELKAELRAAKVKLAPVDTYGSLKGGAAAIAHLVDEKGKKLTEKNHAACPGHSARVAGYRVEDFAIEYVCRDYAEHGHRRANAVAARELTDEQKQEIADREARQQALEANRAARRQWIHDLLPGKINQLAGVYEYMAAALLDNGDYYYDDQRAPKWTLPLLNVDAPDNSSEATAALDDLIASKRIAPFRLMLATSFGIHEKRTEHGHDELLTIRHLEQLKKWGYPLTEIDETALAACREAIANRAHDDALRAEGEGLDGDPREDDVDDESDNED